MAEWVKTGIDVGVGLAGGAFDQFLQNQDDKRAVERQEAGGQLGLAGQYGTYYNYVLPIGVIIATALGALKGDWARRGATAGSMLAGRKITWQFTKRKELPGYAALWTRSKDLEAQQRARLEALKREAEARARALGGRSQVSEQMIPVISGGKGLV